MATGQGTALLELTDSIALGQGRPAHVGQQLLLAIEGRHEPFRCPGLGTVEIVHGSGLLAMLRGHASGRIIPGTERISRLRALTAADPAPSQILASSPKYSWS